jgi:hypothetical protein
MFGRRDERIEERHRRLEVRRLHRSNDQFVLVARQARLRACANNSAGANFRRTGHGELSQ